MPHIQQLPATKATFGRYEKQRTRRIAVWFAALEFGKPVPLTDLTQHVCGELTSATRNQVWRDVRWLERKGILAIGRPNGRPDARPLLISPAPAKVAGG